MDDGSADPIEDSLKERIKAGGITQVVEKKAGAKPATTAAATKTTATAVTKPKEEKKTTEAKPVAESKPKEATASTAVAADKRR